MQLTRYTEAANHVFRDAQVLMQELHHTQLDVEHIFLAMIRQPEGLAHRALERLGLVPDEVQVLVGHELDRRPRASSSHHGFSMSQVYLTPRVQRLMKRAEQEAGRLQDQYISTEHLLIALASEREGASARILNRSGISQERSWRC